MTEAEALLAQLRDIHEPGAPTGLPNSLWLFTAALAATAVLLAVLYLRYRKQHTQTSKTWIEHQCDLAKDEPSEKARLRLARLLRHQMQVHHKSTHNQTTGRQWLHELDKQFNTDWFTEGDGQQFGADLYQASAKPLAQSTCEHIKELLEQENQR